jgi:shikimate kinase
MMQGTDTPIFLVGMPGAGKTTVGRGLARALRREFIDVDQAVEQRCGVRIPTIFELEGEPGFRRRETCMLRECVEMRGVVVATGGGAVLADENRAVLRGRGVVLYLRASVDDLYARTRHDRNRPLLRTADPLATLHALLLAREPHYLEVADLIVDTGHAPISHLVHALLPRLRDFSKQLPESADERSPG